ncbi:hypothetical protein MBSPM3_v1c1610 [Maize bushy stunt phytoplasma]|uniref:HAD-IIB family hydrolase n=1 Tax=Maize bushy stunt phytoplasma TaxID=202462 RepID=A0ABM6DLM8_9MOLU|nr:HAD hydrolase family protein [Maize bushy stunt phytoplasma]AOF54695.1 hypothetical protein MBSPM3_v1c1610 [Maize bushy stunt phytoplasma]
MQCCKKNPIKSNLHLEKPIYKINLFHPNTSIVVDFLKDFEQLHAYYCKNSVVSLSAKQVNKAYGIQAIMKDHKDCQLICMGDGCNDFEMLQFADIGIVMANTHYETLHKVANLTAPHIEKNALYDFFKDYNLL